MRGIPLLMFVCTISGYGQYIGKSDDSDTYFKVKLVKTTDSTAKISWTYLYGDAVEYRVRYQRLRYLGCSRPGFRDSVKQTILKKTGIRDPSDVIIGRLVPYSRYNVTVTAVTISGYMRNQSMAFQTKPRVPVGIPEAMRISRLEAKNVRFVWKAPPCDTLNGYFSGYHYILFDKERNGVVKQGTVFNNYVDIQHLVPYRQYMFRVNVLNQNYASNYTDIFSFRTPGSIPPSPTNVVLSRINDTALFAAWDPPNPPSGILDMYNIRIWKKGGLPKKHSIFVATNSTTVPKLIPNSFYCIEVRSSTANGFGYWSNYACNRTEKSVPDPPASLTIQNVTNSSAIFEWSPPVDIDMPVSKYKATVKAVLSHDSNFDLLLGRHQFSELKLMWKLEGLHPGTQYELRIASVNRKGASRHLKKKFWTRNQLIPPRNPTVTKIALTYAWILMTSAPQTEGTPIRAYIITVEELQDSSMDGIRQFLYNDIIDKKSEIGEKIAIKARLNPGWFTGNESRVFEIGDNQYYGDYHNSQLKKGTTYQIGVGVLDQDNNVAMAFTKLKTSGKKLNYRFSNTTNWVYLSYGIGSAFALILLIAVCVGIVVRVRTCTVKSVKE